MKKTAEAKLNNNVYNLVYNIALRRKDGKVEQDTIYAKELLTRAQAEEITEQHNCDVILSLIGELHFVSEKRNKANSFVIYKKEREDGKSKRNQEVPVTIA